MNTAINGLLSLKLRSFVAAFRAESVALWLLCFYIFIEYIRPYDMYPALNFLPWGQVAIILTIASVFFTNCKTIRYNAMDKIFTLMTLIIILSGIFAWSSATSFKYWSIYTSWVLMYFCIVSILTTQQRVLLFILFFVLINFKLSQHGARTFAMRGFSFSSWGLKGPPGWFNNSGEFALQMVVIFSISWSVIIASKDYIENSLRWWILLILFPGTSAISVLGSSSRGGQIALATVIFILFMKGGNYFRKILWLTAIVFIISILLPGKQIERFNTMGDDETSQSRLIHWENAVEVFSNNPWGIGYKNWGPYYNTHFDLDRFEEIHNTLLQAFVELGYPGGLLFLLMLIASFVMNARTTREMKIINTAEAKSIAAIAQGVSLGLLGTFIAALFMSVLYYPVFWIALALTSALRNISITKYREAAMP